VPPALPSGAAQAAAMSVPAWAWAIFGGFVLAVLALDLCVLHRRARSVSLKEAAIWSAVWVGGRPGLRWPAVGLAGRRHRPGLPGRLPDREMPLARQRLRRRGHLLRVRDTAPLPAPRARGWRHRGADPARRVHPGRRTATPRRAGDGTARGP